MHILDVTLLERCLVAEISQTFSILHLCHSDSSTAFRHTVRSHLREHTGHVMQFVGVFLWRPLKRALSQVLIVVLAFIVTGVEEILKVIETDGIPGAFLRLTGRTDHGNQEQTEN